MAEAGLLDAAEVRPGELTPTVEVSVPAVGVAGAGGKLPASKAPLAGGESVLLGPDGKASAGVESLVVGLLEDELAKGGGTRVPESAAPGSGTESPSLTAPRLGRSGSGGILLSAVEAATADPPSEGGVRVVGGWVGLSSLLVSPGKAGVLGSDKLGVAGPAGGVVTVGGVRLSKPPGGGV